MTQGDVISEMVENLCKAFDNSFNEATKEFKELNKDYQDDKFFSDELKSYQKDFTKEFKKYALKLLKEKLGGELPPQDMKLFTDTFSKYIQERSIELA